MPKFFANQGSGVLQKLLDMDTSTVWIDAHDLDSEGVVTGAAVKRAFQSRAIGLAFDATSEEKAHAVVGDLPDDWSTFDVELVWGLTDSGSGDAVWNLWSTDWPDDSASALSALETDHGATTDTAPAQNVKTSTTLATGVTHTDGRDHQFRLHRTAGAAGDTLTVDAIVLGIRLTKAS